MALNFVTFNQDNTILGVGTTKGFRLYTTEPFSKYYENEDWDVTLMEMLFSTSLVALVLSPRLLRILNTKKDTTIVELTFPMKILAVKMNRKRLAVILEESIYLYDISNMKLLQTIDTSPNPHALCALSPHSDNNYMAYPQPNKHIAQPPNQAAHVPPTAAYVPPSSGEVLIYDANKLESVNVIEAHQSALCSLSVNNTGTMLATASEKGTIIRIFSIPSGERLFHFRRGTLPAQIYCMSFNATSSLLSVSSATETIHIFKLVVQQSPFRPSSSSSPPTSPSGGLEASPSARRHRGESFSSQRDRSQSPSSEDAGTPTEATPSTPMTGSVAAPTTPTAQRASSPSQTFASFMRRTSQNVGLTIAARVGGYLPSSVTEMWEPARDFAWVKVPRGRSNSGPIGSAPMKSVVAMSAGHPQLLVVTSEGQVLVFNVDLEKGGEGVLERQYSVLSRRGSIGYANED